MRLAKYRNSEGGEAVAIVEQDVLRPLNLSHGQYRTLADLLEADDLVATIRLHLDPDIAPIPIDTATFLPPIDRQEVWAAGVTYKRSRTARMEESAGAARFYDLVYDAARPELFFKAMPSRVVGPDRPVRIRADGAWNVPEPELALVLNSRLQLVGYTIGNDMSCRDIEGENPLYLPQAKVYDQSCALGPCITLPTSMPPREKIGIKLTIVRDEQVVFTGTTNIGQMARSFEDLIEYLGRDNTYRDGVVLLTGTGIVPDGEFSLAAGDVVEIAIDGIGTLVNPVVQRGRG